MTYDRRAVLAGVATAAVAGGCLSDPSDGSDGSPTGTEPGTEPNGDGEEATDPGDGASDGDDPPATFDVALERPAHLVRMDEQFPEEGPPEHEVPAIDELNAATREAVATAVETGRYQTADPAAPLLEGLHGRWHVEADGTVYELDRRLPEYVVSGTEVPASAADPDATIGRMDDRIRVLGVDNRAVVTAVNAVVGRSDGATGHEYRATVLDDELAAFLDEYDYVAYPDDGEGGPDPEGYVALELSREDPGPPYEVTAAPLSDENRYGAPVVDVGTFDGDVAAVLETAVERGEYRGDALPDGLREAVAGEAYIRVDDEVYDPSVRDVEGDAVPVAASVGDVDPADRSFELRATNDADDEVQIQSGAPAPFGVLSARPRGDGADTDGGILWSDAYEGSRHVTVERGGEGVAVNDIGLSTPLEPGESVSETYEARPGWGLEGGTYAVESSLSVVREEGGDSVHASEPFTLVVRVPPADDGE